MSDLRTQPSRGQQAAPVPRLDAALDRMLARLRAALRHWGRPEEADRLPDPDTTVDGAQGSGVLGLPFPPLQPVDRLVSALSLRDVDTDLLVLVLLSHRHRAVAQLFRDLGPADHPWPTLGLVTDLAVDGRIAGARSWSELVSALGSSPLLASGTLVQEGSGPVSERILRPTEQLWEALTGLGGWPGDLGVDVLPTPVTGLDGWFSNPIVAAAVDALRTGTSRAYLATADVPERAAARLAAVAVVAGHRPVLLRSATLTSDLVQRALVLAVCRDVVPVFCETGDLPAAELVAPYVGLPLLVARTSSALTAWPRPLVPVPVFPLGPDDREAGVRAALGGRTLGPGIAAPSTAEPRDLALAATDLSGHPARTDGRGAAGARDAFLASVDRRTRGSVPAGGVLSHPRRSWESLVLAEDRLRQLREAVDRSQVQGRWQHGGDDSGPLPGQRGLRMLFCGPPGTGKTLAAEVMAHALGRDVLAINLARLVSKWIGETEKNLEGVFDAAERGDLLLFFDEADAVFARRSEVGDARDRYANLETAYLLGRIETFDGVVVLSTNLRRNIDPAFARRLEFIVPFDPPDAGARQRLWEQHVPAWAGLSPAVDLAELAALYDFSGGLIRNAMTAAAFLAAADPDVGPHPAGQTVVSARHLVHAIEREHAKAGLAYPGPPHRLRLTRTAGEATSNATQRQRRQP